MNRVTFIVLAASTSLTFGEKGFSLPPEISNGIARSGQSESLGDLAIEGVEEDVFKSYIKSNWRAIVENIEILPQRIPPPGFRITSETLAFNSSVSNFASACECLPPSEYVEFLDKLLSLYEKKRISVHSISLNFLGRGKKHYFLAVNWEHPSVRALCQRALEVLSEENEASSVRSVVVSISQGELADNYMNEDAEDLPLPETLPGIKLKRPWGSMIKKYEAMTGVKAPPDPNFPDSNSSRSSRRAGTLAQASDQDSALAEWSFWKWAALLSAICILLLTIRKLFSTRKSRWS